MTLSISTRAMLLSLLATCVLAVVVALALSGATGEAWGELPLSKAGLTAEYCERNRFADFIRQPVNAWSNLVYFFLGGWILVIGLHDLRAKTPQNALQAFPAITLWMGLMLVGLCFGSFFFHASVTQLGQHWDMGFTYAVALGLVAMGGYRWSLLLGRDATASLRWFWWMVAAAGGCLMTVFKWWIDGKVALPALMLLGLALAVGVYLRRRGHMSLRLLLAGVAALVAAGLFRGMDLAKVACDPDGLLQWHALWHGATGLAAFLFWRCLWTERV
jgi:hypothetical protein